MLVFIVRRRTGEDREEPLELQTPPTFPIIVPRQLFDSIAERGRGGVEKEGGVAFDQSPPHSAQILFSVDSY